MLSINDCGPVLFRSRSWTRALWVWLGAVQLHGFVRPVYSAPLLDHDHDGRRTFPRSRRASMTAVWLLCVGHLDHALIGNGGGMTQLLSFAGYRRACVGFHGTHDFMARRHRVFFPPAFMTCRFCSYRPQFGASSRVTHLRASRTRS